MREILFRGQSIDRRKWYEGDLYQSRLESVFFINYYTEHGNRMAVEVNPETVGQYTGLTDKNGTKIFEGDIVTMPAYLGGRHKAVVYFKNGKFAVDGSHYYFKDIAPKNMEVIGNIHDNPKLLEAE